MLLQEIKCKINHSSFCWRYNFFCLNFSHDIYSTLIILPALTTAFILKKTMIWIPELMEKCRTPPRCRSPSMPRRSNEPSESLRFISNMYKKLGVLAKYFITACCTFCEFVSLSLMNLDCRDVCVSYPGTTRRCCQQLG